MYEFLLLLGACSAAGLGLAWLMGKVFGGNVKRIETYHPNPPPDNNRRYWVHPSH